MIQVLSERHLAVWLGYRLELGRPRESEARAGTSGSRRRVLRGPSPLRGVPVVLACRSEDTSSHLLVSTPVGPFVAGSQHLFPHLDWTPGFGGSGLL